MENRQEYHRFRTMEEVRREQMRVNYEIQRKEQMLRSDSYRIGELFNVGYWMDILSLKAADLISGLASGFSSRIRGASSGFGLISHWVGVLTRRFRKPSRRYWAEYDYDEEDYDPQDEEQYDGFADNGRTC